MALCNWVGVGRITGRGMILIFPVIRGISLPASFAWLPWLLFDGELSKLKQAPTIEDLMTRQSGFHDAVESAIAGLEELAVQLQPPPEEAGA